MQGLSLTIRAWLLQPVLTLLEQVIVLLGRILVAVTPAEPPAPLDFVIGPVSEQSAPKKGSP